MHSLLLPPFTRTLPTEICERIINFVAAMEDKSRLQTLCSCALTCRSWLSRSRFHLFRTVVLRSNSQLSCLARTLKDSPLICKSVRNLTVVGAADSDRSESWITVVPMSLSPAFRTTLRRSTLPVYPTYRSHRLGRLTLCDIDLTKRHPRFHQAYSLLGPVANPHSLRIERVRYSQFLQIARIIAAIGPRYFTMDGDTSSTPGQSEAGLDGVLVQQVAGRPTPRVHLRNTVVFDVTLSLAQAVALCHKWPLSAPLLDQVYIRTPWQDSHIYNGYSPLPADQSAWRVFSNFCQMFYPNEDAKTTRTVLVGSKHCGMSCRICESSLFPSLREYTLMATLISSRAERQAVSAGVCKRIRSPRPANAHCGLPAVPSHRPFRLLHSHRHYAPRFRIWTGRCCH